MTFATPLIAAIAAAIAIPSLIILYFLKLRRRDMEVSSTLLWKKAIQDLQANAPFQKLRNNILLILQLIALLIALFAIAQPEFRGRGAAAGRQIILIDRSASMSADDGLAKGADGTNAAAAVDDASKELRLEIAKKKALELIAAMREPTLFDDKAEEAMVIAFDSAAEVRQTFTSNKTDLKRAVESITATDAPSLLEPAFEIARAYTGTKKFEDQVQENAGFVPGGTPATFHIFSDGRLPDADKVKTTDAIDTVVYHAMGDKSTVNLGITTLRADRSFDQPARVNIYIGLQSTDLARRNVSVEASIDGTTLGIYDTQIREATPAVGADAAGADGKDAVAKTQLTPGLGGIVLPIDRAEGGTATVRITSTGADALSRDNVAYLAIPPAKRLSVVLVTRGNLFTETALRGMNLSQFDVKTPEQFQQMLDAGQTAQYDVFVFDRVLPEVKAGEAPPTTPPAPSTAAGSAAGTKPGAPTGGSRGPGLPPGRSLVLGVVPPPPLGLIDQGPGEPGVIVDFQRDHPALRMSSLDKINISKTRKVAVEADSPVKVLARDQHGPALVEITDSATLALVVPFDVGETDWPFDPGWVLFLARSVMYLSETQSGALSEGVRVGDTLATRLPPGASEVRLTQPDGTRTPLEAASDGIVSYGPIQRSGIYTVSWIGQATATDVTDSGRAQRAIAANLLDPSESDLGTVPELSMGSDVFQATPDKQVNLTRKLWPWLLLGALAIVMLEWYVYNRKVAI